MSKQPTLFSFMEKSEISLIDRIKGYIENENIKFVSLQVDYKEQVDYKDFEIMDMTQLYSWWQKFGYFRYSAKFILKGFNYNIWNIANNSSDLKEFFKKVEKIYPDKIRHIKYVANIRNVSTLKEFKDKLIYKPRKISLIEADSVEEIKKIANDCHIFQTQLKNHPEMLKKRAIKKICNLLDTDETIGIELGESLT